MLKHLHIFSKKTEVLALQNSVVRNPLAVNGKPTHLASVHSFKYLGSTVTDDCRLDKELDCRIQCVTTSFGRVYGIDSGPRMTFLTRQR